PDGRVLLAVRSKGAPAPVASRKGLLALTQSLRQARGARGGRLSEIVIFRSGPTLLTIGPIVVVGTPVGAVLAMTPLAAFLGVITCRCYDFDVVTLLCARVVQDRYRNSRLAEQLASAGWDRKLRPGVHARERPSSRGPSRCSMEVDAITRIRCRARPGRQRR